MPNSANAEIYFITAMMILILIISVAACYIFFKTFYAEKREYLRKRLERQQKKEQEAESQKSSLN